MALDIYKGYIEGMKAVLLQDERGLRERIEHDRDGNYMMTESFMSLYSLAVNMGWLEGCEIFHRAGLKFRTLPENPISWYPPILQTAVVAGNILFSFLLKLRSTTDCDDYTLLAIGGLEDALAKASGNASSYLNDAKKLY